MSGTLRIALAALIVMAGLIFLCFVLCACRVSKDEDERMDRRDEHDQR